MLWLILLGYGLTLFVISPRSHDIRGFYWGHDERGREAGLWLLSGAGKYGILLGVNLYGLLLCTVLFLLPAGIVGLTARQGGIRVSVQEVRR
jgi:hypothetical protein